MRASLHVRTVQNVLTIAFASLHFPLSGSTFEWVHPMPRFDPNLRYRSVRLTDLRADLELNTYTGALLSQIRKYDLLICLETFELAVRFWLGMYSYSRILTTFGWGSRLAAHVGLLVFVFFLFFESAPVGSREPITGPPTNSGPPRVHHLPLL